MSTPFITDIFKDGRNLIESATPYKMSDTQRIFFRDAIMRINAECRQKEAQAWIKIQKVVLS
ncbi:MAG: hypothetical protein HDQ88_00890 [Clostridia bacterium]|nr:hypothetical protein [Clostridia bacterium]